MGCCQVRNNTDLLHQMDMHLTCIHEIRGCRKLRAVKSHESSPNRGWGSLEDFPTDSLSPTKTVSVAPLGSLQITPVSPTRVPMPPEDPYPTSFLI